MAALFSRPFCWVVLPCSPPLNNDAIFSSTAPPKKTRKESSTTKRKDVSLFLFVILIFMVFLGGEGIFSFLHVFFSFFILGGVFGQLLHVLVHNK